MYLGGTITETGECEGGITGEREDGIKQRISERDTQWSPHDRLADIIRNRQFKYFGHITRMENERYPKITLEGRTHGTRKRRRPKMKWMDCLKADCKTRNILHTSDASHLASNRSRPYLASHCEAEAITQFLILSIIYAMFYLLPKHRFWPAPFLLSKNANGLTVCAMFWHSTKSLQLLNFWKHDLLINYLYNPLCHLD